MTMPNQSPIVMPELIDARCPVHKLLLARYSEVVEVKCRKCKKRWLFNRITPAVVK